MTDGAGAVFFHAELRLAEHEAGSRRWCDDTDVKHAIGHPLRLAPNQYSWRVGRKRISFTSTSSG